MTYFKRYKFHVLVVLALLGLLAVSARTKVSRMSDSPKSLPAINKFGQFGQALELLPPGQRMKFLSAQQAGADLRPFILSLIEQNLPEADRSRAYEIARAVIVEANHHDMDPFFLLAVINTESTFKIKARGGHGEIGLMQILPSTALWLAEEAGVPEGRLDLEDPTINIRIGATYFASLRKRFDGRGTHYVSAYNMGPGNVRRLIASNVQPRIYSGKVLGAYKSFYGEVQKDFALKTAAAEHKARKTAGRSVATVRR